MLERLLRKLALQDTGGLFDVSIVVVDNDVEGSAREVVSRAEAEFGLEVTYDIEPQRTIPAVRNHCLRLARGNYIGIIDDDEFPQSQWLLNLYRGIHTFEVDGAFGPVFPFFEQHPPAWLVKARLCEPPIVRTGTLVRWNQTYTGNVLLKKRVFDEFQLRFDEKFRTGGSDQDFFKRAMALGCRFVAVQEGQVYEIVPPARQTWNYWIRRSLVNGFNSHKYTASEKSSLPALKANLKSAIALVAYAAATPFCAVLGSHHLINCLQRGGYHLSRLCAICGCELWKKRDF
jgi:glycosyltransferase involved in cell wall biosynthesis